MEISTYALLGYAVLWSIFYWFLSQFIAQLSRDKWIDYVKSEESDEVLVEALQAVIEEIEIRMHDKLQNFQDTFFGSIGAMTAKAKNMDPMNNVRKAAKDGDWMSLMVEQAANKAGLGALVGQEAPKTAEKGGVTSPKTPQTTNYLIDYLNK